MSDELKIVTQDTLTVSDNSASPPSTNTYNFHQSGEGTNIGVAQNVTNSTVNLYIPLSGGFGTATQPISTHKQTINPDYYNLFVILGEKYDGPYFIVDADRALTVKYGTAQNIHERLAVFDETAIVKIKSYPAVFASENYRYLHLTEPIAGEQIAFYGFITDIKPLQNGKIKIFFQKLPMCDIPQELLNQMITELDIQGHCKLNELDKTHWSVKNVNLIEELKLKGISLLVPTL